MDASHCRRRTGVGFWLASWSTLALVLLLASALHAQPATGTTRYTGEAEWTARLAGLLYPESTSWTTISSLTPSGPFAPGNERDVDWPRVAEALGKQAAVQFRAEGFCIEAGILLSADARDRLHTVDIETNGKRDLLYSGANPCLEGALTVIWRDYLSYGRVNRSDAPRILSGQAMRVATGPAPRVLLFVGGCCADPMSEFAVIDPGSADPSVHRRFWLDRVSVANVLALPAGMVAEARDIQFPGELILRGEPVEDDAYDAGRSDFLEAAVFGTIIRKFLPGVTAHQLATFTDSDGRHFALVRLDRTARARAYSTALPSDVGWVRIAAP